MLGVTEAGALTDAIGIADEDAGAIKQRAAAVAADKAKARIVTSCEWYH